jgi:hypothetical protein
LVTDEKVTADMVLPHLSPLDAEFSTK